MVNNIMSIKTSTVNLSELEKAKERSDFKINTTFSKNIDENLFIEVKSRNKINRLNKTKI